MGSSENLWLNGHRERRSKNDHDLDEDAGFAPPSVSQNRLLAKQVSLR